MQYLLNAGILDYTSRFGEEGGYQTIGEAIAGGFPVFLVGLLTVFAVLAIIWGVLEIFHYFAYTLPHKRKDAKNKAVIASSATTAPVTESVVPDTTPDDEEIVAVIAAAIAAAQAETPSGQFRVVSFRKK